MAKWIKANGTVENIHPVNSGGKRPKFKLAEVQGYVGGYVEMVRLSNREIMLVNEEGRLHGLPLNRIATDMVGGIIVGDVVVCRMGEF